MASGDLDRRIRLGEDSTLELKRVSLTEDRIAGPSRNALADELGAFANGRGGTLILGVDDRTHDVAGIPLDALDTVETWIRQICNDLLKPPNDLLKPPLDAAIRKIELANAARDLVAVIRGRARCSFGRANGSREPSPGRRNGSRTGTRP